MTDHPHKLNRLAMHQEWYEKNRTLLFIEASVVMQELLAMCRQYKAERDEARQRYCFAMAEHGEEVEARQNAKDEGWDCFKENTND